MAVTLSDADLLNVAIAAARTVGEILRAGFGQAHEVQFKGSIDIVTEVDRAVEARLVEILSRATPGYGFLTEESRPVSGHGDERWIVDPIDGTVNYARREPRFCVSIALERSGQIDLGVVYDPLTDEIFSAQRKGGAALNGSQCHVSATDSLERALLSTGFPYDAWTNNRDNAVEVTYFIKRVQALRATGSAALDLAAVACGRRDAHWERGLNAYDVAAGMLLVREAGGIVTDYAGNSDALYSDEIVAANPIVHRQMLAFLTQRHSPR